ncbi:MAG TPA: hypothetical protein DCO65_05340 [Spartobacteria bacterium]|jgi:hypothetical protein|nr:hypothetical protein [Spartobacteria bacterium]
MKLANIILLAIVSSTSTSIAAITKLSAADRTIVEHAPNAQILHTTKEIPDEVIRACAAGAPGHVFRLADPGQRFQVGDVIYDRNLPRRRLVWAARIPGYYLVHYEFGGYTHGYSILLVAVASSQKAARVVWSAWGPRLKDYNAFITSLRADELDDTWGYYI